MKRALIILFFIFNLSASQKPIPKYIRTCRRSDPNLNDCFAKNANLAIKYIAKGDPEYNIKTLLPLKWKDIIEFKAPGLKFCLLDILVLGAENMTVVEPNIDLGKNLIQFYFANPLIIWKGHYNATVEENGESKLKNGHVEFHFNDGKFLMTFEYKLQIRNGRKYANISKYKEEVHAVNFEIKAHTSDTNGLSGKDWDNLKSNLLSSEILDACAEAIAEFIRNVFDVVPFNEIFTE